ncbi:hypothetical protein Mgra_00005879, partial [Meloidogyne graminicola]
EEKTISNKKELNEEFNQKFKNLRDGCFPRPKGVGCRCVLKDNEGFDREQIFQSNEECREESSTVLRGKRRVTQTKEGEMPQTINRERTKTITNSKVDPVEERARQNYAAVINELKNKFAGLREGCYPRPKGCLCVIGKDATGREITSRRMKDSECKCTPGERSKECPAPPGA